MQGHSSGWGAIPYFKEDTNGEDRKGMKGRLLRSFTLSLELIGPALCPCDSGKTLPWGHTNKTILFFGGMPAWGWMLELENMIQEAYFATVSWDFCCRNCRGKTPVVATIVISLPRDDLKHLVTFIPAVEVVERISVFHELLIDSFHNLAWSTLVPW